MTQYFPNTKMLFASLVFTFFSQLVKAQEISKIEIKKQIVKNNNFLKLSKNDLEELHILNAYKDNNGITFAYAQQYNKGIKVYNAVYSLAFKNGNLVNHTSSFIEKIETKTGNGIPVITPEMAVVNAAKELETAKPDNLQVIENNFASDKKIVFTPAGIARDNIVAELVWMSKDDGRSVQLTWNINIDVLHSDDWMNVRVNALNGEIVDKDNWTVKETFSPKGTTALNKPFSGKTSSYISGGNRFFKLNNLQSNQSPAFATASYYVLPIPKEAPFNGTADLTTLTNPWLTVGAGNPATTNGWHSDGTTEFNFTSGNNVRAYDDKANLNAPGNYDTSTTALPALTFGKVPNYTLAPGVTNNVRAATTNLFYLNNAIHDIVYQYGFTEAARNFQVNNFGRGGLGGDPVRAEAQDGGGTNNANMATPADGALPRMQMYLWNYQFPPVLTVNTPASIAGNYTAAEGALSTSNLLVNVGTKTANAVLYNDDPAGTTHLACAAPANNVSGKIVLIYRGTCTFVIKIKAAQVAGAIGVVMINNAPGAPITMGGADNTITIPAVMISDVDGATLVSQISNNENITMASGGVNVGRDGDYDNGIVFHEFTHGISNRLTGAGSGCLGNAEQGGEGWSDYYALMLTQNWATTLVSDSLKKRPMGNFAISLPANGGGIRNYPYCVDMAVNPLTYANMGVGTIGTEVHNIGEIWCMALWEMTWKLIKQTNSISPNMYDAKAQGGNVIALNLVTMGMKLQPCRPGFLDARNGILTADSILYNSVHKCAIWEAFAKRGMGFSAVQGLSTSATDQVAAYDLPASFRIVKTSLPDVSSDAGSNLTYNIAVTCGCATPTGYSVKDTLGAGLSYVSSTGGTLSGNVVSFPPIVFTAPLQTKINTLVTKPTITGCLATYGINSNVDDYNFGNLTSLTNPNYGAWYISSTKAHSVQKSWFAIDADVPGSMDLLSDPIVLTGTNTLLTFWNYYNTEETFDGGVVEITTDNGATWTDLGSKMITGGYSKLMDPTTTLAGRMAYTGTNTGFTFAKADLSSYIGKTIRIRFRMTSDAGGGGEGWYIDDIQLINGCGIFNKGALYNPAGAAIDSSKVLTLITPVTSSNGTIEFDAYKFANEFKSNLVWTTNNENYLSRFEVERSANGIDNWLVIVSTGAAGFTNTAVTYARVDATPIFGVNYYRLKTYDRFGGFTYSAIRIVRFGKDNLFTLIPNITSNQTYLVFGSAVPVNAHLLIYDAKGSLLSDQKLSASISTYPINTSRLPSAQYLVTVVGEGGLKETERLTVIH